jgi:hypothetical protein
MGRLTSTDTLSLTEARRRSGAAVMIERIDASYSSTRTVPYAETYRLSTGVRETPVERLQRAAEDEAARESD